MKHFKHLSSTNIREIIDLHIKGEPKLQIARKMGVDNATVHYHINKYKDSMADPEDGDVYTLVKIQAKFECIHPSLKCSCCGKLVDHIRREERQKILELEKTIKNLQSGADSGGV